MEGFLLMHICGGKKKRRRKEKGKGNKIKSVPVREMLIYCDARVPRPRHTPYKGEGALCQSAVTEDISWCSFIIYKKRKMQICTLSPCILSSSFLQKSDKFCIWLCVSVCVWVRVCVSVCDVMSTEKDTGKWKMLSKLSFLFFFVNMPLILSWNRHPGNWSDLPILLPFTSRKWQWALKSSLNLISEMLFIFWGMTHPRQSVGTHAEQLADCLGTAPVLGLKLGGTVTLPGIASMGPQRTQQ